MTKSTRLFFLLAIYMSGFSQPTSIPLLSVYQDAKGIIRWPDDKQAVALYGANYCLPSACDYRAAGYVTNNQINILKTLAEKAGMITPLYTATGRGYVASIPNESIPVTSAYAYPFWTEKKDLSPLFLYKNMHADPDYSPVRYVPEDYPAFAA